MINRTNFYISIKLNLFKTELTPKQIEGMDAILTYWENNGFHDGRHLAYVFATAAWETDKTMQPIEEYGKGKTRPYGRKQKYSGEKYTTPDKIYFGRGHTQNTWFEIYEKLTKLAKKQGKDWDFLNNPELLLQMEQSVWATFTAMGTGLYTGKKLSDYFNDTKEDPINARRIINSLDKAELIAGYYYKFLNAIIG